ncbi:hypothetical protein PAXRUDRAFT_20238 [Paxillus rubicundulus Ve08.2h10]|uniref:Uncharacterized protein n=1 Tax=Paxillus rubicundulus Ve08.2h10 TaxID=930991 RepID=A0A0D0DA55_9AGAM|nr:hypothetical protein PAXRUDRAFT_20238 [Paxillus rubicundulus Ve08.2h10]
MSNSDWSLKLPDHGKTLEGESLSQVLPPLYLFLPCSPAFLVPQQFPLPYLEL